MRRPRTAGSGGRRGGRTASLLLAVAILAGCAGDAALSPLAGGGVRPLSKADGWREGLQESFRQPPFALVEVAADRDVAERAWQENVPDGLPERTGRPDRSGRYGELAKVDFETEAVVVWSSGQSGSCPGWLADIDTGADGTVEIERGVRSRVCTDDYNTYRMLVVVDRDRLPELSSLPTEQVEIDGRTLGTRSLVRNYPDAD